MADTTALKNRIRAAIKANDNQEITGPILQQALLDMVDELNGGTETEALTRSNADATLQQNITAEKDRAEGAELNLLNALHNLRNAGYAFGGIAVTGTNPGIPSGNRFYIVRGAGTYTYFKNADDESIVLQNDGLYVLTYESVENQYWEYNLIVGIDDKPTASSNNPVKSRGVAEAFNDLDMIDAADSQVSPEAVNLTLRKNDGSGQDPNWHILCQLLIPSATSQRAGLMSAAMRNLLYNLKNAGYAFGGMAVTGTNPGIPSGNCFYIVAGAGTYTYFKNADDESIVLENDGLYVLTYESVENQYWEYNLIIGIDSKPVNESHNLISSDGVQGVTLPLQSDINHIVGVDITKTIPVTANTEHSSLLDELEVAIKNGSTFSIMLTNDTGAVTDAGLLGYNDHVGGLPARSQYGNIRPNTWYTFTATNDITMLGLYWNSAKATQSGNISLRVVITGSIVTLSSEVATLQSMKTPSPISFTGANNTFKWGYSTIAALAGHTYRIVPVIKDWAHDSVTSTAGNAFAAGYRVGSTDTLSVFVSVTGWALRDYYDITIPNNVTNATIVIGGRANNGNVVEFGVYDITDAAEAIDNIQIYREGYIDTGGATTAVLKYFYLAEGCKYRFKIANFAKSPLDSLMKFSIGYYPDKNNLDTSTFVTIGQVNTTSGSDVDLAGMEWFISVPRGGVGRIAVKGTTGQHVPYYIENVTYQKEIAETAKNYGGQQIRVHGVDGNKYYENIIPVSGISSYNGKSLQGMAIYKGYAVITYDTGFVRILRLSDYTIVAAYAMPAGVQQAQNHAGQANFSTQFYDDDDEFPLLYVSSYLENKCYILRITMTGCTLIQEITCANAWHFHPDNSGNLIVHFNDWATYRIFDLPDISNASVTLNVVDATDSFSLVTTGMHTAGGFCQDRKLYVVAYYTSSRPEGIYDRLIVYDYKAKELASEIIFESTAIRTHEFEGIAPTGDNSIMVSFVYNQLAELHFD